MFFRNSYILSCKWDLQRTIVSCFLCILAFYAVSFFYFFFWSRKIKMDSILQIMLSTNNGCLSTKDSYRHSTIKKWIKTWIKNPTLKKRLLGHLLLGFLLHDNEVKFRHVLFLPTLKVLRWFILWGQSRVHRFSPVWEKQQELCSVLNGPPQSQ